MDCTLFMSVCVPIGTDALCTMAVKVPRHHWRLRMQVQSNHAKRAALMCRQLWAGFSTGSWAGGASLRAFRTGDVGFVADGALHLCGRRDLQVQIKGAPTNPLVYKASSVMCVGLSSALGHLVYHP